MRDYTLGNFIALLRVANGFSQFQLGRLVGVTDKAVSKWENGATRPRIKTCEKLAAVFGISVDDLLSCQQGDQPMYRTTDGFDEIHLWQKARDNLYKKYGSVPPLSLLCRLDSEEIAFKGKGIIRLIDLVGTMNAHFGLASSMVRSRDYYMSTLVAWLLNATEVNPMKPHWYCPSCKMIHFSTQVKDGWDLPEKRCTCGCKMIQDGHDIPFEGALSFYSRNGISMSLDVASSLCNEAIEILQAYYSDDCKIENINIDDQDRLPEPVRNIKRFLVIPNDVQSSQLTDGSGKSPVLTDFYRVQFPCVPITIVSSDTLEKQRLYESRNGISLSLSRLQSKGIYNNVYEVMRKEVPVANSITGEKMKSLSDIANALDLVNPSFSELRQIMALHYGAEIWENNGETLYHHNEAQLLELPGCREDVWEMVLSHMDHSRWQGTGFSMKVMEDVRLGRYTRQQGMDAETERILHEIGIENWYIDCLKHIIYQWGRAAVIENLIRYMRTVICDWDATA